MERQNELSGMTSGNSSSTGTSELDRPHGEWQTKEWMMEWRIPLAIRVIVCSMLIGKTAVIASVRSVVSNFVHDETTHIACQTNQQCPSSSLVS